MRMSDWSSDVCSSDLDGRRGVARRRARRCLQRAVVGRCQPLQTQRVETDRALAADAVVDRELQLRAVTQQAVGARTPGLADVALLVANRRPLPGELVAR